MKKDNASAPSYFKLELAWKDDEEPAALCVVSEFHSEDVELPKTLADFNDFAQ